MTKNSVVIATRDGEPIENESLEEISLGLIFAQLAITDNKEGTLAGIGKSNPWHIQAMALITGSEERAHKPLGEILRDDINNVGTVDNTSIPPGGGLTLDTELDVRGITPNGSFIDTQGYVAHNDELIVVSFRCTINIYDWLTNLNTTSSAWEKEDIALGFSGYFSGCDDLCCQGSDYKPRVHTGMYNNFIAVIPEVKKYVDPLLMSDSKPRKLFICGHSLGAGIANLVATYYLLEYQWDELPQQLVCVTAGSPRSVCTSMREVTDIKREEFGKSNVRFHRIVKGKDAVPRVPPKILGFDHLVSPTVISDTGQIMLITNQRQIDALENEEREDDDDNSDNNSTNKGFGWRVAKYFQGNDDNSNDDDESDDSDSDNSEEEGEGKSKKKKTKYEKTVSKVPKPFRDHMPDFYLKPIFHAQGIIDEDGCMINNSNNNINSNGGGSTNGEDAYNDEPDNSETEDVTKKGSMKKNSSRRMFGSGRKLSIKKLFRSKKKVSSPETTTSSE